MGGGGEKPPTSDFFFFTRAGSFPVSRLEVAEFSGVISVVTSSLSSRLAELKICSLLLPSVELSGAQLGDRYKDSWSGWTVGTRWLHQVSHEESGFTRVPG